MISPNFLHIINAEIEFAAKLYAKQTLHDYGEAVPYVKLSH